MTMGRLIVRYRTRRMWLDDAWVFVALVCSLMLLVGMWIRTDVPGTGPLNQPREVRVIAYWMVALSFTSTLWAARMGIIFSVIRLIPPMMGLRRISNISAVLFILMWMGLIAQKSYICSVNNSWNRNPVPQCHLGHGIAINELITDAVSDFLLAAIPIRLLKGVSLMSDQRKMLYIIFGSSLLITLVSIIHAIFVLGPSGLLEAITAQAQAATALIVANLGVLGSLVYRRVRRSVRGFDTKPFTYEFTVQTGASVHMRRIPLTTTHSTRLQFADDPELHSSTMGDHDDNDTNPDAERTTSSRSKSSVGRAKTLDLKKTSNHELKSDLVGGDDTAKRPHDPGPNEEPLSRDKLPELGYTIGSSD
ncbi:hypothetical protein L218DRAFT_928906 [Marasmius fiardii PR-910]|nr:hypothetical protein L218DRAFT_928906 [Marasmius fiardii PR-910]